MYIFLWATVALVLCALIEGALAWAFWTSQRIMLIGSSLGLIGSVVALFWSFALGISVILSDLAVVLAVSLVGWFFCKMVRSLSALFAMTLTAAVVDLASFYLGPTRALIETASTRIWVLQYLSFSVPTPRGILPAIGAGDLLFLFVVYSVFLTTQHRHLSFYLVPLLTLEAALVVGVIIGGVPALPFLAGAVGLLWWSSRRREPGRSAKPTPESHESISCS